MKKFLKSWMLLALAFPLGGCVSHQYVHWEDDWQDAAARTQTLSEERTASITTSAGATFDARNLRFSRDSLAWTPKGSSGVSTLPLGEIEGFSMLERRRTTDGALMGGALGALTALATVLLPAVHFIGPVVFTDGLQGDVGTRLGVGALLGAGLGALLGSAFVERVRFLP